MGACFGDGILGFVPGGVEGADAKVQFCEQFAGFGLSHRFREVIDGRVAEFAFKKGDVETRWLEDGEAKPILSRKIGGSAPYSLIGDAFFPDTQILLPGFRGRGEVLLKAPEGHPFKGYRVGALRSAIAWSESRLVEMRAESADAFLITFLEDLLGDFRTCREHRLIFMFGY